MTNALKRILFKIAKLTHADQRWLLAQLTPTQREQFKKHEGYEQLKIAKRFSTLPLSTLPAVKSPKALPNFCQELGQKEALFIAIVLEQGQYDWQQQFLESSTKALEIEQWTQSSLSRLKPASKLHLFTEWQKQSSFTDYLENNHG